MKNFFAGDLYASDYRKAAHEMCRSQMNNLALIYFIFVLLIGAASVIVPFVGSLVISVCSGAFIFSFISIAKNVYLGINVKVENLFDGFKEFGRAFVIYLLMEVYVLLWCLIPIVGPFIAMVKGYSYAMAPYIALDNPDMGYNDCITRSREIMDGHKWQLFCLMFSYIGWMILCSFTFGILYFWVAPRMQQAQFLFYLKITGIGYGVEVEREKIFEGEAE